LTVLNSRGSRAVVLDVVDSFSLFGASIASQNCAPSLYLVTAAVERYSLPYIVAFAPPLLLFSWWGMPFFQFPYFICWYPSLRILLQINKMPML
jgi:hypothetical protein